MVSRLSWILPACMAIAVPPAARAEADAAVAAPRCVVIDVYARDVADDDAAFAAAARFAADREGVVAVRRFPAQSAADRTALEALAGRHRFAAADLPVVHCCDRVVHGTTDEAVIARHLAACLQVEVFVRAGCPRCAAAKGWLEGFRARHPGLTVVERDLAADPPAREALAALVKVHRMAAASVPALHLCNRLAVGFDRPETTGTRLEELVAPFTQACRASIGVEADAPPPPPPGEEVIDVPVLGRLDPARLGMPLFTLAIGLVDGFNPCAMWVLLLLLSILVNLGDRLRILAVAGSFIIVSGAAYFAFMAAWLSVFDWIGCLRPVQVALGSLAIVIGAVHVKDFFAFGAGPSLSIPAAAKPGIYARIRRIVNAENLAAAIAGAVTLAVLVNVVELLCTAGLPALYTNVLSLRGYSTAARYGYLGLYIAAYMFDDTLMVAGVVASLEKFKLQERGGRWLKLGSGVVILALGIVMLLRPEWLG